MVSAKLLPQRSTQTRTLLNQLSTNLANSSWLVSINRNF